MARRIGGNPGAPVFTPIVTHVSPRTGKRTVVFRRDPSSAIIFKSGMTIDADGAPNAYHPISAKGIDDLANAGAPGGWWALAQDAEGEPIIQRTGRYAGFYVSMTWLHREDHVYKPTDPQYWVDARRVRYIAIPKSVWSATGIFKGDLAVVLNCRTGKICSAIVADWGTEDTLGEGSIALGKSLRFASADPRIGGEDDGVVFLVFPGSAAPLRWPRSAREIRTSAQLSLRAWGGAPQLREASRWLDAPG